MVSQTIQTKQIEIKKEFLFSTDLLDWIIAYNNPIVVRDLNGNCGWFSSAVSAVRSFFTSTARAVASFARSAASSVGRAVRAAVNAGRAAARATISFVSRAVNTVVAGAMGMAKSFTGGGGRRSGLNSGAGGLPLLVDGGLNLEETMTDAGYGLLESPGDSEEGDDSNSAIAGMGKGSKNMPMNQHKEMNKPQLKEMRGLKNPDPTRSKVLPRGHNLEGINNVNENVEISKRAGRGSRIITGILNFISQFKFNGPAPAAPVVVIPPSLMNQSILYNYYKSTIGYGQCQGCYI